MARTIKLERPVSDAEAAMARLKAQTRFSMAAYQGSFVTFGRAPLKGRVGARRFTVGLNRRDWLTLLQPTARGRVVSDERGARVEVSVGISPVMLWYMRLAVLVLIPVSVVLLLSALYGAGAPLAALAFVGCLVFTMVCAMVIGVGLNMNNVEGQVDALAAQVEAALDGAPPQPVTDQEAARRRAAAQRQRQGQGT